MSKVILFTTAVVFLSGFPPSKDIASSKMDYCASVKSWGLKGLHDFDACALRHLYTMKKKQGYRTLPAVAGFAGNHHVDEAIQFWMAFWRSRGHKLPTNDPIFIKAMIAVESSFRETAESYAANSTAYGLMQITNSTRKVLTGAKNTQGWAEVRRDRLHLTRTDLEDPVVTIAAGIRWLAHKYKTMPRMARHQPFNSVKYYHSWDAQGGEYLSKVKSLYRKTLASAQPKPRARTKARLPASKTTTKING